MSGFDEVVELRPDDAELLGEILTDAAADGVRVRLAIDDGGVKVAAGRQTWTPALGVMVEP